MKKAIIASLSFCLSLISVQAFSQESIYLSSDQYVNDGIELHNKGEYEKAIASYAKVSKCDPNYELACYEMALTLYYSDRNDEALVKCKEALSLNYDKAIVYSLMGSILDESGKENEGIELLTVALKKWPYNQNILYNLAVCYLNINKPVNAEELLKRSILINPYHSRSHLALAKANYLMGRITQSYLAYNMVMLLNPSANNIAAYEEAISQKSKLLIQEYKYPYPKNVNPAKWNLIKDLLQSEIAFNEAFDYSYDYNYTAGRQSLMLFRKLTFEPSDTSIYSRLYSRLFVGINQKFGFETYLNYILKNIKNEKVTAWSEKNKDKLDNFVAWAQTFLNNGRSYGFSYQDEQNSKQTFHYDDDGNLTSIGDYSGTNEKVKNGTWLITGDEGYLSEKGVYRNDKAQGEWIVYWPDGKIRNHMNFLNDQLDGAIKTYYQDGTLETSYTSKADKKDGPFESYSNSGLIVTKNNYSDNQVNGPGIYYNYNEGFKRTYNYNRGKIEDENTETWLNGNGKMQCKYQNDMINGPYYTWYSNSAKESERNYKNDTLNGKYSEYYPDNQKSKELQYDSNGKITGKIITYDRTGRVTSEESEYKDGRLTGTRIDFSPDGKKQSIFRYQDDHLIEITCFDATGNEIYRAKDNDSSIYLKSFYPDGVLSMEGKLVKDKREGIWKFYNPLGIIKTESVYSNGVMDGIQHTYYENGQIEKEYTSGGNYILGGYREYFINGHLRMQGNYDSTGVAGKWLYYFKNDTLSNIIFYKKGKPAGRSFTFDPKGKLKYEEFFNSEGNSIRNREYDSDGSLIADLNYEYGSHTFEIKYPKGKLKERKKYADNVLNGFYEAYHPNGQIATQIEYSHNLINGYHRKWDYKGNVTYEIPYVFGLTEGDGKWYTEKSPEYTSHYEQDKVQGKTTSYYYNGQKSRESTYADDKRNGNSDYYSPEGILMYRIRFADNTMKGYTYPDKSGNMIPEVAITESTTEIKTYYPNGIVSAVIPLYKGLYNGKVTTFYSSGSKLREAIFKLDDNEGYDKNYYPNNKLRELINYSSDSRNGLYELYFENGIKQKTGKYYMDNEDGEWEIFNTGGSKKEILTYRNGVIYDIK